MDDKVKKLLQPKASPFRMEEVRKYPQEIFKAPRDTANQQRIC
jgi:hypothetical protein